MSDLVGLAIILNLIVIVTMLTGILLLLILVSRTYLEAIFEHIDGMLKSEKQQNDFRKLSVMAMQTREKRAAYYVLKRSLDIVLSCFGLLLTAPLVCIVALAIKLDSNGPAFFVQKRVGRGGKEFRLYRFRTMHSLSDDLEYRISVARQITVDQRLTRVGRFLRRTSLDELPVLVNVLRGDLSFVGTSAFSDFRLVEYASSPEVIKVILSASPGMISLWALSRSRWQSDVDKRVLYDLYYVSHQSMGLDLSILVVTIPSILGRMGTY